MTVPLVRAPAFVRDLATYGDATALRGDGPAVSYADLAARADAWARRLGDTRRLVLLVGAHTVETVAAYLGALAGGPRRPARPGRRSPRELDRGVRPGRRRRHRRAPAAARAPGGDPARAAPRAGAAAQHLRLDRLGQAGPAVARQPRGQRRGDRHGPRHRAGRPRRDDPADGLLLRPVGPALPPRPRRRPGPDRAVGDRRRLLGPVPRARGHLAGRRPAHLRAPRAVRLPRAPAAVAAVHDPGRRADVPRPGPSASRSPGSGRGGACT